ncbi:MAG: hypothetical protein ACXVLX_03610 [Ilumatobacteraceae bacterium]
MNDAMRKFSIRPMLTLCGRTFRGLRGWSGKPTHPPLTDLTVAAYILGATFDVIAVIGRNRLESRLLPRRHLPPHRRCRRVPILVISIMVAALVAVGATFGGSLVFEHGFNVETAGDSPTWHVSETDVMPGDPVPVEDEMSPADRLADSEVAVTSRTLDPLASSSSDEGSADG